MSLLSFLTLGLLGKKNDKASSNFAATLQPSIDFNKNLANYGMTGQSQIEEGVGDINELLDWYKGLMNGSFDEISKNVDLSGLTEGFDDAEKNLYQLGVRGGVRASELGQSEFNKQAAINRILQELRNAAPEQIKELAAIKANIGTGKLQIGQGANSETAKLLALIEEFKQRGKDRNAAIFGSIIGAVGSAAGAAIGGR